MTFTIIPGTPIIVVPLTAPWAPQTGWIKTQAKSTTTFTEEEMIIHPDRIECEHQARHAQIVGKAYAAMGYFGFKRGNHILLTTAENVYVTDHKGTVRGYPLSDLAQTG
jgi:hypothetical protein